MGLTEAVSAVFADARFYLERLDTAIYTRPLELYAGSSIGQHTRHFIEFFQCLIRQAPSGIINYEARQRDERIEQDPVFALACIDQIETRLHKPEVPQKLVLEMNYSIEANNPIQTPTCFEREVIHNIEHAIHHLALIKIGLRRVSPELQLRSSFGVAPSTIRFQQSQSR
ncbi:MAG: hypothetical protein AAF206_10980 [Bacteroidota bacterium]